jgi:nicotinate-nucleotide adenylyltransferase
MERQRIGLFFGSFNPIHHGHLMVAEFWLQEANLNKIIFIVSPHNPFKTLESLWPEKIRFELCELAIANNPFFEVSDIEFKLNSPSYTYKTVEVLQEKFANDELFLIMGMDNLISFDKWKHPEIILKHCSLLVYNRNQVASPEKYSHNPKIILGNSPTLHLSSTHIRDCLKNNKSIRYLVPEIVRLKILDLQL